MKPYGLKRKDRVICGVIHRKCSCGDWSSKHTIINKRHSSNRRAKKAERQLANNQVSKYY